MNFYIENWLWKSNFGTIWHLPNKLILRLQYLPLGACWFLGKNLSNFVLHTVWKLDNPYYHTDYSDDDYTYPDDDEQCDKPCDFYDDADCAKECHHDNFRDADPLKKMFGDKVETCCSGHQYFFMDHCEVKNCLEIML